MIENPKDVKAPKITWREFVWHRFTELVMAAILFYGVTEFSERMDQREQDMTPASAWFKVNEVYVPDHEVGSNPPVIYDRQIIESFRGFFLVEVQRKLENGLWWSACSGSGISDYEAGEAIPSNTVDWNWFVYRDCPVPPGIYRLRTSWEMKRPGWPVKNVVSLSNEFTVVAPGTTPMQIAPVIDGTPFVPLYEHSEDG